jgi:hypothetical protein
MDGIFWIKKTDTSFSQRFVLPNQSVFHVLHFTIVEAMFALDVNSYIYNKIRKLNHSHLPNLVPWACDPREGTRGPGTIRFREESDWPLIWNAQFGLSQDSWLPATDYPRASRSFPRVAGSGNDEIVDEAEQDIRIIQTESDRLVRLNSSDRLVRLNSAGKMAEKWHHAYKDFLVTNWLIFISFVG